MDILVEVGGLSMGNRRVVITAIGVYSNNGNNTEEFWESCVEGKSGFKACTLFDVSKLRTGQVGQITEDIPYMVDDPKELGRIQYIIKNLWMRCLKIVE